YSVETRIPGNVAPDGLDQHRVLQHGRPHLHPARAADSWMRNVAVAADLVRGVDDDDALAKLVRKQPRALAQHRGLANARPAQQQDALATDHDVANDLAGPGDRAAHAHGESGDATRPIADGRDAVQRPLDTRPVVVAELTYVIGDVLEVRCGHRAVGEKHLATRHACLGLTAEVDNDFEQLGGVGPLIQRAREVSRQRADDELDLLVPPLARAP